ALQIQQEQVGPSGDLDQFGGDQRPRRDGAETLGHLPTEHRVAGESEGDRHGGSGGRLGCPAGYSTLPPASRTASSAPSPSPRRRSTARTPSSRTTVSNPLCNASRADSFTQ